MRDSPPARSSLSCTGRPESQHSVVMVRVVVGVNWVRDVQVEETEKGWYITYIHRDPLKVKEEEKRAKRERAEMAEEERARRLLEEQVRQWRMSTSAEEHGV